MWGAKFLWVGMELWQKDEGFDGFYYYTIEQWALTCPHPAPGQGEPLGTELLGWFLSLEPRTCCISPQSSQPVGCWSHLPLFAPPAPRAAHGGQPHQDLQPNLIGNGQRELSWAHRDTRCCVDSYLANPKITLPISAASPPSFSHTQRASVSPPVHWGQPCRLEAQPQTWPGLALAASSGPFQQLQWQTAPEPAPLQRCSKIKIPPVAVLHSWPNFLCRHSGGDRAPRSALLGWEMP